MLSDSQDCELSDFDLILQLRHIGRESSIHSACNCACFAFAAAINLSSMLLPVLQPDSSPLKCLQGPP